MDGVIPVRGPAVLETQEALMFWFEGIQAGGIISYLGESQPFCSIQVIS